MKTTIANCVLAALASCAFSAAATADIEYEFTLVDAFITTYDLRECYIFDINDQNVACGTATIKIGSNITYTGFHWNEADEKTPVSLSWPKGINNLGQVAAVSTIYDITTGQSTTMPLLPGTYFPLVMLGINDAGIGVGYVQTCNCSNSQGFLQVPYVWHPLTGAQSLSVPGANGANRINKNNLIVGWTGGWSKTNSFLYDLNTGSYFLMSSVFEGTNVKTTADDISDNNVVVGRRKNATGSITWGYTWSVEKGVTLLPLPPEGYQPHVHPSGINAHGTIVGAIFTPTASSRAFVYDEANGIRDLNTLTVPSPGFTLMQATAVNDNGWIVGYGYGGGGMYKSFVLKPIAASPSPAGDLNGDGSVGVADLLMLLSAWGPCANPADCPADLDGNGLVGVNDLLILLANWG